MTKQHLQWTFLEEQETYRCRVFSVKDTVCRSPEGETKSFSVIDAPDWAIIIPLLQEGKEDTFVMVHQWRHGSHCLSTEFPGGVIEKGEDPVEGARRELQEETGYTAGTIQKLGEFSPNPAIMTNRVHVFLARDLLKTGAQHLDADEYVDVELVPFSTVLTSMGKPPYVHALMASALTLFIQWKTL
ncbi:MAG: NUDIX hydrolase [Treponemataceae bacterium]|nr:NUDIX hydrolase [Treponemataceae bacterium]